MQKIFVLMVFMVLLFDQHDTRIKVFEPQIIIENDVYISGQLPQWGRLCQDTGVYGSPRINAPVYYSLRVGDVISIHEMNKTDPRWVMIEPARWIPLSTVCKW